MIRPCQCVHEGCSSCSVNPGPAYALVKREGATLEVCTRCKLGDDDLIKFIVSRDAPVEPFLDHDAAGFGIALLCGLGDHLDMETQ